MNGMAWKWKWVHEIGYHWNYIENLEKSIRKNIENLEKNNLDKFFDRKLTFLFAMNHVKALSLDEALNFQMNPLLRSMFLC